MSEEARDVKLRELNMMRCRGKITGLELTVAQNMMGRGLKVRIDDGAMYFRNGGTGDVAVVDRAEVVANLYPSACKTPEEVERFYLGLEAAGYNVNRC
jgi:G:T-mismatch repair DNA endonuclease (very short patch repair protein)